MKSINYTLLGDETIAKDFGKKGTSTDITIYDKKESEVVKTWTVPTGFPEKIQPLFQAINMGEYVIFYVTKLDKFTGEQIVALDVLTKTSGLLCHSYEVDRNKLLLMIKDTVVEKYKLIEMEDLKKEINALQPITKDVQRGDLLCLPDSVPISQEIIIDYSQNKFFKGELGENQMFLVNIGLQIRPAKIISLKPMKLSLGKPAVFDKDDICVILKQESQTIRIVGSGTIVQ